MNFQNLLMREDRFMNFKLMALLLILSQASFAFTLQGAHGCLGRPTNPQVGQRLIVVGCSSPNAQVGYGSGSQIWFVKTNLCARYVSPSTAQLGTCNNAVDQRWYVGQLVNPGAGIGAVKPHANMARGLTSEDGVSVYNYTGRPTQQWWVR